MPDEKRMFDAPGLALAAAPEDHIADLAVHASQEAETWILAI
jgi:hypothetical protein